MPFALIPGYIGPEVIVPVTSVIAAIGGFFLMMGRSGLSFIVGLVKRQSVREHPETDAD